ncbi:GL15643 [Drosophila persimilis]|uniref:GL15643 n=1 Tax=Drosophila persimilis TaxID=7234 RepID=B4HD19_DROPE|nr:GL15643 [Drosophila persimilis]
MARTPTGERTDAPLPALPGPEQHQKAQGSTALRDLGREITQLVEMLEDGKRRSIHQPMRDSIESIRMLYELVAIQLHDEGAKAVIRTHQSSQTSPIFRPLPEPKRKQAAGAPTPRTKRTKAAVEVQTTPGVAVEKDAHAERERKEPKETPFLTVINRRRRKRPQKPTGALADKTRPDAIVITTKGEKTYAEILRMVRTDETLRGLGDAVVRIRRTQKGELLLQLNMSGEETETFKSLVANTLKEHAEVRSLSHRVTVECKDLDEIPTTEDICEALRSQVELAELSADDIQLRKAYGGTQTATIRLPAESAQK